MRICGLQTLSLVDYPGKLAATVFTGGCNLRCPFCHNALLVNRLEENAETYSVPEVLDFLRSRRGLLDGVVISGGEPLLHLGINDFAKAVKELGFSVKLDTNGCFPERLKRLIASGLVDYVAMDIKSSPSRYSEAVGLADFDVSLVRESAALLMCGSIPFEFRTTLVRELHTEEDLLAIGEWLRGAPQYFLQRFVDSGNLIGQGLHAFSAQEMQAFARLLQPFFGTVSLRGVD